MGHHSSVRISKRQMAKHTLLVRSWHGHELLRALARDRHSRPRIRTNSIARANFGLLLIAALAICRFFDSDLSFVARGVGFIIVGVGFLVANLLLFKRRTAS